MQTTNHSGPTLERQSNRTEPRRRLRRLRIALHAMIAYPGGQLTPEPEAPWHDLTRQEPRAAHPCEKERTMIANAIRQGCTTPQQVLSYYLARIQDSMEEFATPVRVSDVCFVRLIAELADVVESGTLARGLGTAEALQTFQRETAEVVPIAQLVAAGACFPLPMGATPR